MKVDINSKIGTSLRRRNYTGARVGLELEYEECRTVLPKISNWSTSIDHSLRAGGIEFISTPLKPKDVRDNVREMLRIARDANVAATPRCGLHVHMNVTDLTWDEMYRFIVYYTLLEPTLFKTMCPGRENSHFCVPTWANTTLINQLYSDGQRLKNGIVITTDSGGTCWSTASAHLTGQYGKSTRLRMLSTPKYAALNLGSLKKFGTLEFRQAPSSLSHVFIEKWTDILVQMRRVALSYNTAESILDDHNRLGLVTLCENVGLKRKGIIDHMDQEDAIDAATIIAGHVPVKWQQLSWEVS